MIAVLDRLSRPDRQRLLDRIAELDELAALLREPGQQRPPDLPPATAAIRTPRRTE